MSRLVGFNVLVFLLCPPTKKALLCVRFLPVLVIITFILSAHPLFIRLLGGDQ